MTPSELNKLISSFHPLENKLLLSFSQSASLSASGIMAISGLDESRLDMAAGWLTSKGLLAVTGETVTTFVSLTETGAAYKDKGTPETRIIAALREGKQFTVKDIIQSWGLDPTEVSSAVGALKEAKVIQIVQGGVLALAGGADERPYAALLDLIRAVGEQIQPQLPAFPPEQQKLVQDNFHKRGKGKGIFRITEKKDRTYSLTADGKEAL
ncbi:MAG: pheS, partial [Nitrospirae bacterium]|nr:pheS [Nitrospirota bacterium]